MGNRGLIFPFLIHTLPPFFMTGPEVDQIFPMLDIVFPMKDSILMGDLFSIWWFQVDEYGPESYGDVRVRSPVVCLNSFEVVDVNDSPSMMMHTLFKVTFICCNEIGVQCKMFFSVAREASSDTVILRTYHVFNSLFNFFAHWSVANSADNTSARLVLTTALA